MSYPDPPPPPHQYMSQPFHGVSWPPFLIENEQPDVTEQFSHPTYKRPRNSDNPTNFVPPPPPPNPRVNPLNIFYKTRICAKFTEGTCRNGDTCSFAHGVEDLRDPPPNWQEYIREKDGRPGGGNINFQDDQRIIRNMKVCKRYFNGEECPYGDKCNFLHERRFPMKFEDNAPHGRREREISAISIGTDVPGRRESTVINIGTTGHHSMSRSGDFDATVFFKTKLCSRWEMGQCPYGDRCHYAHGMSDLKVSDVRADVEQTLNAVPIPANPLLFSVSNMAAPANLTTNANDGDDKKKLRWKLGKKINQIYGDWISDDGSPPRCCPSEED